MITMVVMVNKIKVGETYHILIPSKTAKLYKIHILAIIDNCQIVYKWYGKHKQWWHYEVEAIWWLQTKIDRAKTWKKE